MNWQENYPLIPESWKRPWMLWWAAILPQVLLLWMNIQSWKLISGEMTDAQLGSAFRVFAGEVLLLAGHVGLFAYLWRRGKAFTGWACGLSFMAHIGFYWLLLYSLDDLIPSSVSLWILPFEQFLYYQFALTMPAVFFALASLVCFPRRSGRGRELGVCLGLCVGIPLLWFAMISVRMLRWLEGVGEILLLVLGIASTVVVMAALIRAIFILCEWSGSRNRAVQIAYAGVFGLVAPFGGLVLNQFIPFPVDFQSPTVYLLAALNGLALLVPPGESLIRQRLVWMARALMYPFTLYFFVVFLPFLPLTLPAMLAAGAGFLILAPTVLFLVHTRWLAQGFQELPGAPWKKRLALGVCVSIIPALLAAGAALDRVTLHEGLKYVYQSGPDTQSFEGSRWLLRHSLYRLRDYKEGLHLPFISAFYNKVVFDGLVLPDDKMQELHRVFFGQEMKPYKARSEIFATRSRSIRLRPTTMQAAPTNAVLSALTSSLADEDGCRRLLVKVEMTNPEPRQQEFATDLVVPEGVMVSGFWLYIGKDRVPGRLFEKKTALWVYRMIRDFTRRDPGLLFYRDATHLELRVFPLASHETRTVEIEFLYPESLAPTVMIGDRTIAPAQRVGAPRLVLVDCGATGAYVTANAEALAALPSVVRRTYLHFIVDRSLSGALASTAVVAQCRSLAAQFPEIADCAVTFANYELQDWTSTLAPVEGLGAMMEGDVLPVRGGFCRDRAIRHALTTYAERLCQATNREALFLRYPVIVVVTSGEGEPLAQGGLQPFMGLAPDVPWFYTAKRDESLKTQTADGRRDEVSTLRARPIRVVILEWGGEVQACPLEGSEGVALSFVRGRGGPLRVYDPARGVFQPLEHVESISPQTRYGQGAEAWLLSAASERDAAKAFELQVALNAKSRETGILVPATSYIVVENSAQWKMLEQTEKKKLKNLEALEIASTPEPSTWALMLLAGALLGWKAWRRRVWNGLS